VAGDSPPFSEMLEAADANYMITIYRCNRWFATMQHPGPLESELPPSAVLEVENFTPGQSITPINKGFTYKGSAPDPI